jgi:hypothetical protein
MGKTQQLYLLLRETQVEFVTVMKVRKPLVAVEQSRTAGYRRGAVLDTVYFPEFGEQCFF